MKSMDKFSLILFFIQLLIGNENLAGDLTNRKQIEGLKMIMKVRKANTAVCLLLQRVFIYLFLSFYFQVILQLLMYTH